MTNKECVSDLGNIKSYFLENFGGTYPAGLDYAINMINSGDAVQYTLGYQDGFLEGKKICERPQGEWIIDGHHIRCNRCNEYICDTDREGNKIPDNFCPNCGADMRGDNND